MQKIRPFLWFDDKAEEAANFYVSIFKDSRIEEISRYEEAGSGEPGRAITVAFQLEQQSFIALNGGPEYKFTPAISLFVDCETQSEVDDLWSKLIADGGEEGRCGWLTDKYGLSWQIIPRALGEMLGDANPSKAQSALAAMMEMRKIDIDGLRRAYDSA